jgi:hypothetical protein
MLPLTAILIGVMASTPDSAFDPGPAVGAPLPAFSAPDQSGRVRSFDDLGGPKGLVLVFYRSADW